MPCAEPFRYDHLEREIAEADEVAAIALRERNARQLEDFISDWPCGSNYGAVLYSTGMGNTDVTSPGAGDYDPSFSIYVQTGGFSVAGNIITVPVPGLYVWRQMFYWNDYPTVGSGTTGMCYGGWYSEVLGSFTYGNNLSFVPFYQDGSSAAPFRYHTNAGIVATTSSVEVLGGPQYTDTSVVSGDTHWDMHFALALVASLDAPACA